LLDVIFLFLIKMKMFNLYVISTTDQTKSACQTVAFVVESFSFAAEKAAISSWS